MVYLRMNLSIKVIYSIQASGCEKVKLDVTDEASIKSAVEEIYAKAGHIGM
jgi:NAD(P)-dependent dehydrogenase (short-subunit alcohol dehydrogenase family)